jgi:hypothetical protein
LPARAIASAAAARPNSLGVIAIPRPANRAVWRVLSMPDTCPGDPEHQFYIIKAEYGCQ